MTRDLNRHHSTLCTEKESEAMTTDTHSAIAPLQRYFTTPGTHPYDAVEWDIRNAVILKADGTDAFRQEGVVFPAFWSQSATNIVASKYFRGQIGTPQRETSVKQMITRVVDTIRRWGYADGYFDAEQAEEVVFAQELTHILLYQVATFNSPVWFNVGIHHKPQCSACFIIDVEDSIESIVEWYRQEAMIFKGGSGAGINVSKIRSKHEPMSGGGKPSGPLSFMKAADASAGVIKSGGKVRRAAKMVVMDSDHPDIEDFIWCKKLEEEKARALIAAGYDAAIDGEAYTTVAFQSANHSVGVSDAFMRCVENDEPWMTHARTSTDGGMRYDAPREARQLFRQLAEATWHCGDPGLQFHDMMNAWHTTPSCGRIVSSNPCGEFLRPPNEACNLSSINLLTFIRDDNSFDVAAFRHVVNVMITAMEILVGRASYPTPAIEKNSHEYRTLGLGYNNLGALLMAKGLPYDSDEGRDYAASITALMTGQAYRRSAELAAIQGPFAGYAKNKEAMGGVLEKHYRHIPSHCQEDAIWNAAEQSWHAGRMAGEKYGYRNAQVTLLAPTGTISFMMDADTTGIEPAIALVSHKKLVGGGTVTHVNGVVERALKTLGYPPEQRIFTTQWIVDGSTTMPNFIKPEHLPVFDCAFPSTPTGRAIHYEGHIRMVAAVQPFLSMGISKTINMPQSSTVEDIEDAYMLGWKLGCKSLAIYRDGCKATQVLTTQGDAQLLFPAVTRSMTEYDRELWNTISHQGPITMTPHVTLPQRKRLPDERPAITHKATINGYELYITIGLYENGQPGEMFLNMAKEGSTISGLMDAFATAISIALQYGVPLSILCEKFKHLRFEPAGFTKNADIPIAKSLMDYLFRWLEMKFLHTSVSQSEEHTVPGIPTPIGLEEHLSSTNGQYAVVSDAPSCAECGSLCERSGSCYICSACGTSSGCS